MNFEEHDSRPSSPPALKRGLNFWMVLASMFMADMLSVLDLSAVSTALPTIVEELHGIDFIWAGSAYTIAATAILPLVGNLVSAFGRKPGLVGFILVFAVGSAISGSAHNLNILIAGRAIQGLGGGGCIGTTEILFADLIPLADRGKYQGLVAAVWALACSLGPLLGGGLAQSGAWRWLFYLNLPICGLSVFLALVFLRVNTPKASILEKITQIDWIGIGLITGSTVSILLAITWGGLRFPWSSVQVLVPLIIGAVGIVVFFFAEIYWIKGPTIPSALYSNRTSFSGYIGTFFHGITSMVAIYYLPVYFQATQDASAIGSGVDIFPTSMVMPMCALFTGVSVQVLGCYRPQNYVGWALMMVGFGLLSTLSENSSRMMYLGAQVPVGVACGILWVGTQFPILAPLPFSNSAHALAFFTFTRCFAQSWGIVIGGTILQNILLRDLPRSFTSRFQQGVQIAYAAIPTIKNLEEPLKGEVRATFANATRLVWQVMIGVAGAGLLSCLLMRELELRKDSLDDKWGLKNNQRDVDGAGKEQSQGSADGKSAEALSV